MNDNPLLKMLPVPDELALCQLCGSKNDLKALPYDTKVKNFPVMEVRIVCSKCFIKLETNEEAKQG